MTMAKIRSCIAWCGAFAACMFIRQGAAEVLSSGQNGFEVRETLRVSATPQKVYAALLQPSRWWSSSHTFSGNAANITLDAKAGGCWCEILPEGGSVEHMRVVYVAPGNTLRLRGALGPFQGSGVEGAMTWSLRASANATDISVTYAVGGYGKDGFEAAAKGVDQVLGEQLQLLKKLIEG
ncbi:MAG: SRPBCC domain-containing protein [Pseudomonadota bacterium]|nr:SRPBCC domain-containing protein [Pseudomonadota bacterium]